MNKDQAHGSMKNIAGKVQEQVGKIVGSQDQQIKGIRKQVEGQTEKHAGDAKHIIEETVELAKDINRTPKG